MLRAFFVCLFFAHFLEVLVRRARTAEDISGTYNITRVADWIQDLRSLAVQGLGSGSRTQDLGSDPGSRTQDSSI